MAEPQTTVGDKPEAADRDRPWWDRAWLVYALVAVVAAAARALYLAQMIAAPFFDLRTGDGRGFHRWAQQIAAGTADEGVFYQAPLFPYVLALIYKVAGSQVLTVRVTIQNLQKLPAFLK